MRESVTAPHGMMFMLTKVTKVAISRKNTFCTLFGEMDDLSWMSFCLLSWYNSEGRWWGRMVFHEFTEVRKVATPSVGVADERHWAGCKAGYDRPPPRHPPLVLRIWVLLCSPLPQLASEHLPVSKTGAFQNLRLQFPLENLPFSNTCSSSYFTLSAKTPSPYENFPLFQTPKFQTSHPQQWLTLVLEHYKVRLEHLYLQSGKP